MSQKPNCSSKTSSPDGSLLHQFLISDSLQMRGDHKMCKSLNYQLMSWSSHFYIGIQLLSQLEKASESRRFDLWNKKVNNYPKISIL